MICLDQPNRRMRTRMSGGVGGGLSDEAPYPDRKWQREVQETVPDADARIIRKLEDIRYLDPSEEPTRPEYTVVSKDRAKLGYAWKPAAVRKKDGYHCPDCDDLIVNRDGIPIRHSYLSRNKRSCGECGSALWQADNHPAAQCL
jgi:hypothetical protein